MLLLLGSRSPPDLPSWLSAPEVEREPLAVEAIADRAPPGWRSLVVADPQAGTAGFPAWVRAGAGVETDIFRAEPLGEALIGDAGPVERIVLCLVFSNPVEGREADFNAWYSRRHLPDLLRVPGYLSVQRFLLARDGGTEAPSWRYLAIYEVDRACYPAALIEVAARSGTELMPISDAAERPVSAHFLMPAGRRLLPWAPANSRCLKVAANGG